MLKLPVPEPSQWRNAVSLKFVSRDGHVALPTVAVELQPVVEKNLISHGEVHTFMLSDSVWRGS